ncbi:MAG: cellulase N-terminal Ig-like domain-containing protein, partial [Bacteroidales bacterium]
MRHPIFLSIFLLLTAFTTNLYGQNLQINDLEYFEGTGINVLVYSNNYSGMFCDEKTAAIELIQRGERISTGGGIRLMNTPEQWDIFPDLINRTVNRADNSIEVELKYNEYDFTTRIKVTSHGKGVRMAVYLDQPVPEKLVGRAGLNWEFFPAAFFGKMYMMDGKPGILPLYPADNSHMLPKNEKIEQFYGLSTFDDRGRAEFIVPHPFSKGNNLVFAPEDSDLRVSISSQSEINLFDGRNLAQNGTFVVRSFLPGNKTGKVLEWYIEPSYDPNWVREPNIGFSQIGYTPAQKKVAVAELDKNAAPLEKADIIRVSEKGEEAVVYSAAVKPWGVYNHRYNYATIDFSEVQEPGLYYIRYGESKTNVFPVNKDVYEGKWHLSMDVFLPVQMDHMEVNEGYRTWHGRSHMDDALQAPVDYEQFDGYRQG